MTSTWNDETASYSIDLVRMRSSGDVYVAKTCAYWQEGECIGYILVAGTGPLHTDEVAQLHADPRGWDADPDWDPDWWSQHDDLWVFTTELESGY